MATDDHRPRFGYRSPLERRPWWRRLRPGAIAAVLLTVFTVGSAAIWFYRDVTEVTETFGPGEGELIVNINTATAEELETLPGIGPALAQLIIAGRPYATVDELDRVRGVGAGLVDSLRPLLTADGDTRRRE